MIVAITSTGVDLEAPMDPRFGRCSRFLLVQTDDLSFEVVDNPHSALPRGAGIQAARLLAERGVAALLTGNCGPNAHDTLTAAHIPVYLDCRGSAVDALDRLQRGELTAAASPNVAGHVGRP